MWVRALAGTLPLRAEPGNTGGCTGDMAGGRIASPCSPYAGASFAGWSGQGGCGGSSPCGASRQPINNGARHLCGAQPIRAEHGNAGG